MSINLQKGQRIDLTKGNAGLNKIYVGLGWDPVAVSAPSSGGGFFKSLFSGGTPSAPNIDCDASVIMLTNDKLATNSDVVYFGNLKSDNGAVTHSGDNLTGAGDGDDEQIVVELKSIPANYNRLVFVVNIYDAKIRKQHFGMIQNAYIRIVNGSNNEELLKYNLSDDYTNQTTLITGELYRHETEWKFAAIGTGSQVSSLREVIDTYR
jgi:stress response protein SCP2